MSQITRNHSCRALFTIAGWGLFFAVLYVVATTKTTLTVYDPFAILDINPARLRTHLRCIVLIYVPPERDSKANKETLQEALPQIVRNHSHIDLLPLIHPCVVTQTLSSSQRARQLTMLMSTSSNSQRHIRLSPTKRSAATSSNTAIQTVSRPSALVSLSRHGSSTLTIISGSLGSTESSLAGSSPILSYAPSLPSASMNVERHIAPRAAGGSARASELRTASRPRPPPGSSRRLLRRLPLKTSSSPSVRALRPNAAGYSSHGRRTSSSCWRNKSSRHGRHTVSTPKNYIDLQIRLCSLTRPLKRISFSPLTFSAFPYLAHYKKVCLTNFLYNRLHYFLFPPSSAK